MNHRGNKAHTGKIRHKDMGHILRGDGKKDQHASKEHHKANCKHDMEAGCSPGQCCEKTEEGYEYE